MSMANEKNLIPQAHKLTVEEASRGGQKSGEVRREKKTFKNMAETLMSIPMKSGKSTEIENIKNFADIKGKNPTVKMAILIALAQKALKGDIRAFELLLAILGENPAIKIEADVNNTANPYDQLSVDELRALARKCEADEQST
jgi:hypothetical protein